MNWPEGSQVTVIPAGEYLGLDERDWLDTPQARERLATGFETIEPLDLTPEDEAEIAGAREAVRQMSVEAVRTRMGFRR